MHEEINTLIDAINAMRSKGYNCDFILKDGAMLCKNTKSSFKSYELVIDKVFRFEGNSNPDDMSVLYAVSSLNGTKGIIIDAYGMYEDTEIGEFMKNVKIGR
jgi:hypothetical protein